MTDDNLNELSKSEILQIWQQLAEQEKHFNSLETQYRLLASTWLLACFGGIGFLMQKENVLLVENKWLLIASIAFIGAFGVLLLWILDIRVYHKLLNCVFLQGVKLELQVPWLPGIRTDMMMSYETGDVASKTSLYYQSSVGLLIAIGSFCGLHYLNYSVKGFVVMAAGLLITVVIIVYMHRSGFSKRSEQLYQLIKAKYRDFAVIIPSVN
jgi:hypothetical protein